MIGGLLALAPAALASAAPFTWRGAAATPNWSATENWEGGTAPTRSGPVALEFPRFPGCINTCYDSRNDISGLPVESLRIDDGDKYTIEGEGIVLGAGGLSASPASGSSGSAGDIFKLPIALDTAQTWSIYGRDNLAENGVLVDGGVTGSSSPLTFDIGGEPVVYLTSNIEVGPVAIDGVDTSKTGISNGLVSLLGVQLNSLDGNPVSLNHIFLIGSGTLGPLTAGAAELEAGSASYPTEGIETPSATFDNASGVAFQITGSRTTPDVDYSQLSSHGHVQLGGASLIVVLGPPSAGASCPSLTPGQQYTLLSTAGTLSGLFGNAPEGGEIPITFAKSCGSREVQKLRIEYHESGTTQTVTATVPETHVKYDNTYEKPNAEGATWDPISSGRAVAEAMAAKQKANEEAKDRIRAATPTKASTGAVSLAGTGIPVQSDGVALVKLDCIGNESCVGKLTLSAMSTAKEKKKSSHTITIGTDKFVIANGKTTTAHVKLDAAGRSLLANAHQHLAARLEVLKLTPAPAHTQITSVHLTQQKPHGKAKNRASPHASQQG